MARENRYQTDTRRNKKQTRPAHTSFSFHDYFQGVNVLSEHVIPETETTVKSRVMSHYRVFSLDPGTCQNGLVLWDPGEGTLDEHKVTIAVVVGVIKARTCVPAGSCTLDPRPIKVILECCYGYYGKGEGGYSHFKLYF